MALAIGQCPPMIAANHKINLVALAPLNWFVEIGFSIRQPDPLTARRRAARLLQDRSPALRFPRPLHPLAPLFFALAMGRSGSIPDLLAKQSDGQPFGPL